MKIVTNGVTQCGPTEHPILSMIMANTSDLTLKEAKHDITGSGEGAGAVFL